MTDEVVTHASTRVIPVPGLAKPVALITLDNGLDPTQPNTFGRAGLRSLNAAFDAALAADPAAIAVTGKPYVFSIGADLGSIGLDRETTLTIGKLGHDAFRRFTDSDIPTFAFLNGVAIGGGLELALACHYRTVASDVAALSFPECALGLFQGWGGTQLLPNLIGPDRAVTVIIENALNHNKVLDPAAAHELGVVDVVLDADGYLDASLAWLAGVVTGETTVPRPEIDRGAGWDAAIARARGIVEARTHGASPGPLRAVELLDFARHHDLAAGYLAESEAMADVLLSDELRASLYAFGLVQERMAGPAHGPEDSPARPVTTVGVVGSGAHAAQLALLFARQCDLPVLLSDTDQAAVDGGVALVHAEIGELLGGAQLSADEAEHLRGLVSGSPEPAALRDAEFVLVAEDRTAQAFADLEECVPVDCVLAVTAATLPVTELASALRHPERVVGCHFRDPVMPLLEIARAGKTDDATLATALAVAKRLGKSAVLVADAPGFVVDRLLTRFLGEIVAALDEGTPFDVAEQSLYPLGLPMTPLAQLGQPAAALRVAETLHAAFPDRFGVSENLRRLVAAGTTSFVAWDAQGGASVDPEVVALWRAGSAPSTSDELRDRALAALADEARRLLDDGVVSGPPDIDVCVILGAGWPFWLGGITPYLDRAGVSERATGRRFLPPGVASVEES